MRLDPNDPRVAAAPDTFESSFPSDSALLSERFQGLLNKIPEGASSSLSRAIFTRINAENWRNALAFTNKVRVTTVGVLSEWLPDIASIGKLPGGFEGPRGLFAAVPFIDTTSGKSLAEAVGVVGLDLALNTVGAVPIVGGCMKFILNLGHLLDGLFMSPEPVEVKQTRLPWDRYQKDTDEGIVDVILKELYRGVDLNSCFLPPFGLDVPWSVATGVLDDGREVGRMWVPFKNEEMAYGAGVGGMPGTWRIAGYVQATTAPADPKIDRYFASGEPMRRGRVLTDTANFYPATAQTTTLGWNQVSAAGSPDMYTVDTHLLEAQWTEYFDNFFDSVWREYKDRDEWAGEWAWPYLCVRVNNQWQLGGKDLGTRLDRPHPAPLITPDIFKSGPATTATRNLCLYLESTTKPIEQIGTTPNYVRKDGRIAASGGPAWDPTRVPGGMRCVRWPDGRELLAPYARPDVAILVPAIRRLRERQRSCLRRTLVCAYVRPRPVDGAPAHAAFAHETRGKELRDLCLEMRQLLLKHPARFAVMLKDVDVVDKPFADLLRASGVNNSPAQLSGTKDLLAGEVAEDDALGDGGDPIPDPLPPMGGLPFDAGDDAAGADAPGNPWRSALYAGGALGLAYLFT